MIWYLGGAVENRSGNRTGRVAGIFAECVSGGEGLDGRAGNR